MCKEPGRNNVKAGRTIPECFTPRRLNVFEILPGVSLWYETPEGQTSSIWEPLLKAHAGCASTLFHSVTETPRMLIRSTRSRRLLKPHGSGQKAGQLRRFRRDFIGRADGCRGTAFCPPFVPTWGPARKRSRSRDRPVRLFRIFLYLAAQELCTLFRTGGVAKCSKKAL